MFAGILSAMVALGGLAAAFLPGFGVAMRVVNGARWLSSAPLESGQLSQPQRQAVGAGSDDDGNWNIRERSEETDDADSPAASSAGDASRDTPRDRVTSSLGRELRDGRTAARPGAAQSRAPDWTLIVFYDPS